MYQALDGIPVDQQRYIFRGRQLVESRTLGECDTVNGSTLHFSLRLRGD